MIQTYHVMKHKNCIRAENVVPIRLFNVVASWILTICSATNIISLTGENIDIVVLFTFRMTENNLPLIFGILTKLIILEINLFFIMLSIQLWNAFYIKKSIVMRKAMFCFHIR